MSTQNETVEVDEKLADILNYIEDKAMKRLEMAKADFLTNFATNPASAISWRAGDVVQAQEAFVTTSRFVTALRKRAMNLESALEVLEEISRTDLTNLTECLQLSSSTCPFSNAVDNKALQTKFDQFKSCGVVAELRGSIKFELKRKK